MTMNWKLFLCCMKIRAISTLIYFVLECTLCHLLVSLNDAVNERQICIKITTITSVILKSKKIRSRLGKTLLAPVLILRFALCLVLTKLSNEKYLCCQTIVYCAVIKDNTVVK